MTDRVGVGSPIDKVIHEPARLAVLTYLATSAKPDVPFTELRARLLLSGGNLSVQLRNLEEAGYVRVDKLIVARKPVTTASLTKEGYVALKNYALRMEEIVQALKARMEHGGDTDSIKGREER